MHTHSHRAPYSKIHFIKISHSEFPGLAQTSWYHSAAGYPLSFLKIFLRLPYLHPRWLELVSRLPCPFSAWAALTRRELGAGCSSSPCGDRLGAFLWERERYIIYVLSKILENICYPRRQIFGSKLLWLGYFSLTEAVQNAKLADVLENMNSRIREFQKETLDPGASSSGIPGPALPPPPPHPFLFWPEELQSSSRQSGFCGLGVQDQAHLSWCGGPRRAAAAHRLQAAPTWRPRTGALSAYLSRRLRTPSKEDGPHEKALALLNHPPVLLFILSSLQRDEPHLPRSWAESLLLFLLGIFPRHCRPLAAPGYTGPPPSAPRDRH